MRKKKRLHPRFALKPDQAEFELLERQREKEKKESELSGIAVSNDNISLCVGP